MYQASGVLPLLLLLRQLPHLDLTSVLRLTHHRIARLRRLALVADPAVSVNCICSQLSYNAPLLLFCFSKGVIPGDGDSEQDVGDRRDQDHAAGHAVWLLHLPNARYYIRSTNAGST
eukprot:COSAG01_NODE_9048_length_2570_cov_21.338729_2_plen_117_part_00